MSNAPDSQPDPVDEEAAQIDARSEDAPEKIEELLEHAQDLGREPRQPTEGASDSDGDEEPEVLPG